MLVISPQEWESYVNNVSKEDSEKLIAHLLNVMHDYGLRIPVPTKMEARGSWQHHIWPGFTNTFARIAGDVHVIHANISSTYGWSILQWLPWLLQLNDENAHRHDHDHSTQRCIASVVELFAAITTLLRFYRLDHMYYVYVDTHHVEETALSCCTGDAATPYERVSWAGEIEVRRYNVPNHKPPLRDPRNPEYASPQVRAYWKHHKRRGRRTLSSH